MAGVVHALEFLEKSYPAQPRAFNVVFGDEWLLRNLVLERMRAALLGDEDIPFDTFDGEEVDWRDVRDEVATVSLFGQGKPRLVVVHSADKFISEYRAELEKYAASPSSQGVLILVARLFAGNTRLYKLVQKQYLAIDCRGPELPSSGKDKIPDKTRITKWLTATSEERHRAKLSKDAASLLFDLVGADLGLLDHEVEKLAIYVGEGGRITPDVVHKLTGGWRTETTWDMIDAILDGEAHLAIERLGRLLHSGEHANAIFGSLAWSLRRFAAAVRLIERGERSGRRLDLKTALSQAGIWDRKGDTGKSERQMRQLGRVRAGKLYRWLLELDLSLKGTHARDERARWAIEQLILRLAREFAPSRPGK